MPGQTRVAGGLIKGRLSEKNLLHPFPRWRRRQVITLLLAGKEASLKYTQGEDGLLTATVVCRTQLMVLAQSRGAALIRGAASNTGFMVVIFLTNTVCLLFNV